MQYASVGIKRRFSQQSTVLRRTIFLIVKDILKI